MRADELMIGDWVFHYVCGEEKIKPVQVIGISFDGIQGVYQKGDEIWNFAYYMLWCDSIEDYIEKTTGLFPREETPEQLVKRYFEIK